MPLILKTVCEVCKKEVSVPSKYSTINLFDCESITEENKRKLAYFLVNNMPIILEKPKKNDMLINIFFCSCKCQEKYMKGKSYVKKQ